MMINGVSTGWGNEAFETGLHPEHERHPGSRRRHRRVRRERSRRRADQPYSQRRRQRIQRHHLRQLHQRAHCRRQHRQTNWRRGDSRTPTPSSKTATSTPASADRSSATKCGSMRRRGICGPTTMLPASFSIRPQDDPNVWAYTPDLSQQGREQRHLEERPDAPDVAGNATHKLAFMYTQQTSCKCPSLQSRHPDGTDREPAGPPAARGHAGLDRASHEPAADRRQRAPSVQQVGLLSARLSPIRRSLDFSSNPTGMNLKTRHRRLPERARTRRSATGSPRRM